MIIKFQNQWTSINHSTWLANHVQAALQFHPIIMCYIGSDSTSTFFCQRVTYTIHSICCLSLPNWRVTLRCCSWKNGVSKARKISTVTFDLEIPNYVHKMCSFNCCDTAPNHYAAVTKWISLHGTFVSITLSNATIDFGTSLSSNR